MPKSPASLWSVRAGLVKIESSSRHLLSIINDILDLWKIKAGMLHLEAHDFSLLDNVASMVSSTASAKGLRIMAEADGVPPWLHGDETRVRQALLNYASNAVKFTSRGSVTLRVELLLQQQEQGRGSGGCCALLWRTRAWASRPRRCRAFFLKPSSRPRSRPAASSAAQGWA